MPFNNTYCRVINLKNDFIVEVKPYDSAVVQKVIDDNEIERFA